MDVVATLRDAETEILDEAAAALARSHLSHYDRTGAEEDRQRLHTLFDVIVTAIADRQLGPVADYAGAIAAERFSAGFDIAEVQTAFNVLEEAMWRTVVASTPPEQLAESIGLVSTVLGAGKDALATAYVGLATRQHVGSLDLTAMFEGT